ncbi:MAG: ATP phosphoribosyltransferase regulatory subunit [Clostridia bacterium]|nr:ATP phosphoribosyltransferase regulatory subunit [Clostridia bacterium]
MTERILAAVRELYGRYGYLPYKMSKFEEYDLYVRNKDFLISDSVITFTDTNGKLMALKPDVTLSIIKNSREQAGCVQKVYYSENVYRVSNAAHCFKEILQAGLECMGDIDDYHLYEVLRLAAESLRAIAPDCVLDISHLGITEALLNNLPAENREAARVCIGEKNAHELRRLCEGCSPAVTEALCGLISTYGTPAQVLPRLKALLADVMDTAPIAQLERVLAPFAGSDLCDVLRIDCSVVGDSRYYNGLVFKGFVKGLPDSVLSGGQYDKLMQRVGRSSGAVGFAVYLDELERLEQTAHGYDVDTLLLYEAGCDLVGLQQAVATLAKEGSVSAQQQIPDKLTYRQLVHYKNGEVTPCV